MSALTGSQIKNSYQGLLKLEDSSTGITSNFQTIQDGLGNNTGLRIAENILESPNMMSYIPLKSRYYGNGFQPTAPSQNAAGTQNIILANTFFDLGRYSYSAMSVNVITATSTSDTCELAFYTTQMTDGGLMPHTPILSGITVPTTPAGIQTITFGSPLSFSAYGAGVYWVVVKISNSGVQPTVRYGIGQTPLSPTNVPTNIYGFTKLPGQNGYVNAAAANGNALVFSGQTTFDNPFANTIYTTQSTTASIATTVPGVILHTI